MSEYIFSSRSKHIILLNGENFVGKDPKLCELTKYGPECFINNTSTHTETNY